MNGAPWDAEFVARCKAAETAEFEAYVRPVRAEMARLRAMHRPPTTDPLDVVYPALDRWRQYVLEHGGSPLEVAAAWEITAFACERDGALDLVAECHTNAAAALGVEVAR